MLTIEKIQEIIGLKPIIDCVLTVKYKKSQHKVKLPCLKEKVYRLPIELYKRARRKSN